MTKGEKIIAIELLDAAQWAIVRLENLIDADEATTDDTECLFALKRAVDKALGAK